MNMIDELKAARESQCFMSAEIAKLQSDLAKLDHWRAAWAQAARWNREDSYRWMREQRKTESELAALRSRNAELVNSLHLADGTANLALQHRDIAEQRNAELVAALRDARVMTGLACRDHWTWADDTNDVIDAVLARAESGTPGTSKAELDAGFAKYREGLTNDYKAMTGKDWDSGTPGKHPDTVRLDWMLQSPFTAHGQCCNRDDIDAAMMGGAK